MRREEGRKAKAFAFNKHLKRLILPAFMAGIGVLPLLGCETNPATGEEAFTAFLSEEEEAHQGKEQINEILRAYGGRYPAPELQTYIDGVAGKLIAVSEMPDRPFKFYIADTFIANAFAVPGGHIVITRGMLALLGDEAELAGVLAHEIAHITARHAAQGTSRETSVGLAATLFSPFTLGLSELLNRGAKIFMRSYDRDEERESDDLAIRYLQRAGYDPQGVSRFLHKLDRHGKLMDLLMGHGGGSDDLLANWRATHPPTSERVDATKVAALAASAGTLAISGPEARQRYLAAIDGLIFLQNPYFGTARVRIIQVQPGDRLENLAQGFPVAHTGAEWLSVINGLEPGQDPIPGTLLKIVSYH